MISSRSKYLQKAKMTLLDRVLLWKQKSPHSTLYACVFVLQRTLSNGPEIYQETPCLFSLGRPDPPGPQSRVFGWAAWELVLEKGGEKGETLDSSGKRLQKGRRIEREKNLLQVSKICYAYSR